MGKGEGWDIRELGKEKDPKGEDRARKLRVGYFSIFWSLKCDIHGLPWWVSEGNCDIKRCSKSKKWKKPHCLCIRISWHAHAFLKNQYYLGILCIRVYRTERRRMTQMASTSMSLSRLQRRIFPRNRILLNSFFLLWSAFLWIKGQRQYSNSKTVA